MAIDLQIPGAPFLYMKVGVHAREPLEEILERKQMEYKETGMIFWGYGGSTCHPSTMVQPFAKQQASAGHEIVLVMEKITSNHFAEPVDATKYSEDGVTWKSIPDGIHARGSRYALILNEIHFEEFDLNLQSAKVAVGPSRGKSGHQYIRGQADKGCFEFAPVTVPSAPEERDIRRISLYASLKAPYAVFLK